jgi:transposase
VAFPRFGGVCCWIPCCQPIGAQHGTTRLPAGRRKVLDLVEAGRPIAGVAKTLGISDQSIYSWRRQDRIDRGLEPGLTSSEKAELAVAKRRIAELETELWAMRRAV